MFYNYMLEIVSAVDCSIQAFNLGFVLCVDQLKTIHHVFSYRKHRFRLLISLKKHTTPFQVSLCLHLGKIEA